MAEAPSPRPGPPPSPRAVGGWLLLGMFLLVLGTNALGVTIPIRGHERGSSMLAIGLFSAAWSGGFIAASFACGSLLSRFGHRGSFFCLALLSGGLAILFPAVPHDGAWIAFRFASGFGFGGAAAIIEAWLLEASPDGRSFARYMVATLLASVIGTFSLAVVRPDGPLPFLLAGGSLLLSLVPVHFGRTLAPARPAPFRPRIGVLAARSPLAAAGCLLAGLVTGAIGGLGPVFGMMAGLDMRGDTLMLAANSVGGALGYAPITALSHRCGRRAAIGFCALLGTAGCLGAALLGPHLGNAALVATLFTVGVAQYPIYGLSVGLACEEAPDRAVPAVGSEGILLFGLGAVTGPLVGGQFLRMGPAALLAMLCLGFATLLVGAAWVGMSRPRGAGAAASEALPP